ncbi:MAG: L-threonylcarbamoyladenylate synthase [Acidimicrobiia bacterium]|nr:L-threonylcarbamoyladenylate synthase [Acidimicrobiia bacterium]
MGDREYRPSLTALLRDSMHTRTLTATDADLATAGDLLRAGRLVAFPTETVYGLGANALDPEAVRGVFEVKERPADNPLIVHLPDLDGLERLVREVTPLAGRIAAEFWPGPLTMVLEARPEVPKVTTGGLTTVAVRVPDHPVAIALLRMAAVPVAAPSANRSGRPSPTTAAHVMADLAGRIDAVVDGGRCVFGIESTVVDVRGEHPVVLREGAVTREDLGVVEQRAGASDIDASPGTRHRHYQPSCRVEIAPAGTAAATAAGLAGEGVSVGLLATCEPPPDVAGLGRFDHAGELAALLYAAFRDGEEAGLDVIVVEAVPDVGVGRAVMDRLRRASA